MWRCRLLGHRFGFRAEGRTMRWRCERGCGAGGTKEYDSAAAARRYAAVFDRRDASDLGRRAPLIGLFPLRLWHRLRSGRR
ncbi:MAG: hypothetical protein ACRDO8_02510 [Nocardioidaceae bacterium]